MSWWSKLFGVKGEKKGESPAPPRPPTYQELVDRIDALQGQIEDERKANAQKRQRVAARARDDQALLERYRTALEFYASEQHWRSVGLIPTIAAHVDRGYKARRALGRT